MCICVSFDLNIQICFEILILFHFNLSPRITCTNYFEDTLSRNQYLVIFDKIIKNFMILDEHYTLHVSKAIKLLQKDTEIYNRMNITNE